MPCCTTVSYPIQPYLHSTISKDSFITLCKSIFVEVRLLLCRRSLQGPYIMQGMSTGFRMPLLLGSSQKVLQQITLADQVVSLHLSIQH
jgi:hypothetical protein